MSGAVKVVRNKKVKYQRLFEGEVEVCCHRVEYWYDITGVRLNDDDSERLEEEAEERAKSCIIEGYYSGDLCAVVGIVPGASLGEREQEVFGWWSIKND